MTSWYHRYRWALAAIVPIALVMALVLVNGARGVEPGETDPGNENGWLGVYIQDIDQDLADSEGLTTTDGVLVTGVIKDSPAEKAGIEKGDVVVRYDSRPVRSTRRLTTLIDASSPGEAKEIVVLRDGKEKSLNVTIGGLDDEQAYSGDFDWDAQTPEPPEPPDVGFHELPHAPGAFGFSLGMLSTARIGVALYSMSDQLAEHFGAKDGGALINEVEEDSPAAKAGLQAGDVIVEIDHKGVNDPDDVRRLIARKREGDKVTVRVIRAPNEEKTVDVTVEASESWSGIGERPRMRVRPDQMRQFEWNTQRDARRAMRGAMRTQRDVRGQMRDNLRESLEDLRRQMDELREELKKLKK